LVRGDGSRLGPIGALENRGRRLAYAHFDHLEQNPAKDIHAPEICVDSILDALHLVACMLDQC